MYNQEAERNDWILPATQHTFSTFFFFTIQEMVTPSLSTFIIVIKIMPHVHSNNDIPVDSRLCQIDNEHYHSITMSCDISLTIEQ